MFSGNVFPAIGHVDGVVRDGNSGHGELQVRSIGSSGQGQLHIGRSESSGHGGLHHFHESEMTEHGDHGNSVALDLMHEKTGEQLGGQ